MLRRRLLVAALSWATRGAARAEASRIDLSALDGRRSAGPGPCERPPARPVGRRSRRCTPSSIRARGPPRRPTRSGGRGRGRWCLGVVLACLRVTVAAFSSRPRCSALVSSTWRRRGPRSIRSWRTPNHRAWSAIMKARKGGTTCSNGGAARWRRPLRARHLRGLGVLLAAGRRVREHILAILEGWSGRRSWCSRRSRLFNSSSASGGR